MATKAVLQMVFKLDNDKDHTISLLGPKSTLADADVRPVMNNIIAKNAIVVNGAKALSPKSAAIVKTDVTKLF